MGSRCEFRGLNFSGRSTLHRVALDARQPHPTPPPPARPNGALYTLKRNVAGMGGDDWQSLRNAVHLRVNHWQPLAAGGLRRRF